MTEDDREREHDRFAELRRAEDPALRDELIEEHLWLARHCARRFAGKGEARDDLEQVASLALVKAVDRFDPSFGVRFSTFAVPTITGELRRHFRDRTWSVRVTRRLKDLHLELKAANELLSQDLGRAPTMDELAESLDVTVDEVLEALEAGASYRATSLTVGGTEDAEHDPGFDDEQLGSTGARVALAEAMRTLPGSGTTGRLPALLPRAEPVGDRRAGRGQPGARLADPAGVALSARGAAGLGGPPR